MERAEEEETSSWLSSPEARLAAPHAPRHSRMASAAPTETKRFLFLARRSWMGGHMMPGLDGVAVLKRLRQEGIGTPALFLTAKADVEDRVKGLDAGADDYLAKPFAVPELLARVRAMLRRKDTFSPDLLQAGPLTLNRSTYELCWNGRTQPLSGREFQVMEMLMERLGCVVPCDDLLFHVWGWDSPVEVSVVWVHISNLRKKMEKLGTSASIRFLRGAGYVLEVGA